MALTTRADTQRLFPGRTTAGDRGLGVVGDTVPGSGLQGSQGPGYLFDWMQANPGYENEEVRGVITRFPSAGTLTAEENTAFVYEPAGSGEQSFDVQAYVNGVAVGPQYSIVLRNGLTAEFRSHIEPRHYLHAMQAA